MITKSKATVSDLYQVPGDGKAELVGGELVLMSPTGGLPNLAGGEIFASLRDHARRTRTGYALADNAGFVVNLPHRQSFSPGAAYHVGDPPTMRFFDGAPVFAAEVRSENDYGPAAETAIALKRADYFAAGTLVVWDVDLLGPNVVQSYRADAPDRPVVFRRGDVAHAELAVPGWTLPVDNLFW